ncbi:endonuclease [Myroides albus]|uniref:endonuclease I family protein n=1 Tax=Myroides albus TaxID=2562892 RepID=UPI001E5FD070|nr:endonuclease [Myroides albus]UVD78859.1 endonuclease [Myroides albus]
MKKKSLLLVLGLSLLTLSCTKDPIVTDPTDQDWTEKPADPDEDNGQGGNEETTDSDGQGVDGVNVNQPDIVANFNDWETFVKTTNTYGVNSIAKAAPGQGRDGKNAMHIKGQYPDKNDYVFTIENQSVSTTAKTIIVYIKGKAAKSLSFNLYRADGTYDVYNLRTDAQIESKQDVVISQNTVLEKTTRMSSYNPKNGNNDYTKTTVETANQWVKLTLNLEGADYNKSGNGPLFSIKIGNKADYDLFLDSITFDDAEVPGNGGETGPTNPGEYTIPAEYAAYYAGIDFTKNGMELKAQLASLVTRTHKPQSYTPGIWEASKYTDQDPENSDNVILIYGWTNNEKDIVKRRTMPKSQQSSGGSGRDKVWEREHVFAKSLAVDKSKEQVALHAEGRNGTIPTAIEGIAGHDAHNLRPINGSWNGSRGNKEFVNGSGNSGPKGNYWYPGDEWKGDVARMMMYMHIRYENENGGGYTKATKVGKPIDTKNGTTADEMIDLFLKWNAEDPVSPLEKRRNEYHGGNHQYSQGNRNPFIDNPYLANQIWGMENKYKAANLW